MGFHKRLSQLKEQGHISKHYENLLLTFWQSYKEAIKGIQLEPDYQENIFMQFLDLIKRESEKSFVFEPFHSQVREPIDYYTFGLNFTRPLLEKDEESVLGKKNLKQIESYIAKGGNVILFANHQTELDPLIISCLLEENHAALAENMIFVAGQKVLTDCLAIPFSMGCNLLCIYSKRHIDHDPDQKERKQLHNQKTMKLMSELLKEGGKCIYVAPSGGRDRPNKEGVVEVSPFDPDSIEMFRLMALQSKTETHFFPLALNTYNILPPPSTVEKGVGERRSTTRAKVHICFGDECNMQVQHPELSRKEKREVLAKAIWDRVQSDYKKIKP